MPRGYVWGVYIDDNANLWRLRVNADYFEETARGWVAADPSAIVPLLRLWKPRCVLGVDEEGRQRRAIVAWLGADLWTGSESVFQIEGTDQTFHPCTVISFQSERRR